MVAFVAGPLTSAALNTAFNAYTVNAQTGTTYTFALTDHGGLVTATNAAASTYTIPPNSSVAFAVGDRVRLLNSGAGLVTLAPGSGVTITGPTLVPYKGGVDLIKTATNTWYVQPYGSATEGLSRVAVSTFAAASSASIDNCFNAAFTSYRVLIDVTPSGSATATLKLRVGGVDDSTASSYVTRGIYVDSAPSIVAWNYATTYWQPGSGSGAGRLTADLHIYRPAEAVLTHMTGQAMDANSTSWVYNGAHTVTTAFDGLTLAYSAGTITGSIRVYPYN